MARRIKQNTSVNHIFGPIVETSGGVSAWPDYEVSSGNFYYYFEGSTARTAVVSASVTFASVGGGMWTWAHYGGLPNIGQVRVMVDDPVNHLYWHEDFEVVAESAYNAHFGVSSYQVDANVSVNYTLSFSDADARLLADTLLTRETSAAASGGTGDGELRYSLLGAVRLSNNRVSVGAARAEIYNEGGTAIAYTVSLQTDVSASPIVVKD